MADHSLTRTKFQIDGRQYEAVGLFSKDGSLVDGEDIFRRVSFEGFKVIGEEDEQFIFQRRTKIPRQFQEDYYLFTGRPMSGKPKRFACFWFSGDWHQLWLRPEFDLGKVLVLCVCP